MKKYVVLAFLLLISFCFYFASEWKSAQEENRRLSGNQTALLDDIRFYKTQSGENVAKVQKLELTKNEFEKQCKELKEQVNALGIKTKYLQNVINTITKTEVEIRAIVRDSIVYRNIDEPTDTLRCIDFADDYMNINGCIHNNTTFEGKVISYDSLLFVVHRVPKKFLFFRWGTKAIELDMLTKNPHSKITFNRYIELKK
jgi:seryl-tRNA synthetase